jgi:hypothetical protein
MRIEIINIPKDKFNELQTEVVRAIFKYGLNMESIQIDDGNTNEWLGFEFEIIEGE